MDKQTNYYKVALNAIYEVSRELASSTRRRETLNHVLQLMGDSLDMTRGMILFFDDVAGSLYVAASLGLNAEQQEKLRYRAGEGIVGKVFKMGVPILVHDIREEPAFTGKVYQEISKTDPNTLSFFAVPIKHGSKTLGVLAVDKSVADVYSYTADIDLLKMISSLIGSFLAKVSLIEAQQARHEEETNRLAKEVRTKYDFSGLVGISQTMKGVFDKIKMVVGTRTTVLLRGESGTGKEVVAKTVHFNSDRAKGPFIAVNCAAIPGELIEAELFGYEKGAFTGAHGEKKGKFEAANGGTIFLDEIGDMPHEAQSKLLRVLQEMKVQRVGGTKSIDVDVRVVAATNKDLEREVKQGAFRLDLYYRLNVMTIFLPPLRKRKEDIPHLAQFIVDKFNTTYDRNLRLDRAVLNVISRCNWPGNIRELENCLERAMLASDGELIAAADLSCQRGEMCFSRVMSSMLDEEPEPIPPQHTYAEPTETPPHRDPQPAITGGGAMGEREMIVDALDKTGHVQAKAARMLGMTVRQLNYRIQKYDIEVRKI